MGDALQLIPIIIGIKHLFPEARVCLLTSTLGASILKDTPAIDEVFILEKEEIVDRLRQANKDGVLAAVESLRRDLAEIIEIDWDWVINFSYTFHSALLGYLVEAKHRSGMAANKHRQYISKEEWYAYSLASFVNRRYSNFNWIDINKFIAGISELPTPPYMTPDEDSIKQAHQTLNNLGFIKHKIIGMVPGASAEFKKWPIEKFGKLGKALTTKNNYKILIFGDDREIALGTRLKTLIGEDASNLCGKTTIKELKAYLSLCDLLVTNDTGPMHLASAVGTKVVALFFSTHFTETGPYGSNHIVIHPDIPCFPCQGNLSCAHKSCLTYISPEIVEETVLYSMGTDHSRPHTFQSKDKDQVRAFISTFDTWDTNDWVPLDKRAISFQDFEKLILKISWLAYSNKTSSSNQAEEEYLARIMDCYHNGIHIENIRRYGYKTQHFQKLLTLALKLCMTIQEEYLKPVSDPEFVKSRGEELMAVENDILEYETQSSISFLSELLTTFQENIEKTDPLTLSTKTIGVYQNIIALTDIMAKRTEKAIELISKKSGELKCYT